MSIQVRRGSVASFDPNSLLQGEFGYQTDAKRLFLAHGNGTVKQVVFVEDYANGTGANNSNKIDHAVAADSAAAGGVLAAQLAAFAPLASPTFTGDPKAPTPATTDNDTSVATTAFVNNLMTAYGLFTGWIPLPSLAYASTDAPMYTATMPGDYSAKIGPGSRIRYTQGGVTKYGLVHAKPTYNSSTGLTTLLIFGGTDYPMTSAGITSPSYTQPKVNSPDFPPDPAKWTVSIADTSARAIASPTSSTYQQAGSLSFSLPVGSWRFYMNCQAEANLSSNTSIGLYIALSSSTSSVSDTELFRFIYLEVGGTNGARTIYMPLHIETQKTVAAKTTYYPILKPFATGYNEAKLDGSYAPTVIKAISNYL